MLDLEHEEVVDFRDCTPPRPEDAAGGFHIEGLIEVCSAADQRAFEALWRKHVTDLRARAAGRGLSDQCQPDPGDDTPSNRGSGLYITPAGLAVYSGYIIPRVIQHCMMLGSTDNPVIVPWREVMPFLKPGPWRDELLKR